MDKIKIFENWKNEFFKIKELDYFDVYLIGTFNDFYKGKFSKLNSNKKYTKEEIYNMTDSELMTLEKFHNTLSDYIDIDVVITGNDDIEKIKKVLSSSKVINTKYEEKPLSFDLRYQSCGVKMFELGSYENDMKFDCKVVTWNDSLKIKTIQLPYKKHQEIFEMGYRYFKPTLLKKQAVIT